MYYLFIQKRFTHKHTIQCDLFLFMILVYSNFKMHVLVFYKNVKYNNNFFLQNWIPKMVINIAHTAFDTPLLFTAAAKIEFLRYIAHT